MPETEPEKGASRCITIGSFFFQKKSFMKAKNSKDRAAGAIMGALIGDALGVGPHWYYDLDQLKVDYGEWIDDYTTPKPDRFHAGLKAGENSQTGQVIGLLLESVAGLGNYNESDFCQRRQP